MSDYDFRPGGSLKFKTGVVDGGVSKKCDEIFPGHLADLLRYI